MRKLLVFSLLVTGGATAADHSLLDAVAGGDDGAVSALLASGVAADEADASGTTALLWAVHRNDNRMAKRLIQAGAKVIIANTYGVTPLAEAAGNGNAALVAMLLKAGANANAPAIEGEPPLLSAARNGNPDAVRLLLDHGANVNARESWRGQTALMWAAAANQAAVVRLLIQRGADLNARSTPWPPEKVKRPKNGNIVSDRPKGGLTALLYAAREGALEAAKELVLVGAGLNLPEPDGTTPLLIAILNAHYDVAELLLEHGADPNLADLYGRAPLYAAIDMNTLEPSVTRPAPKQQDTLSALDLAARILARGGRANVRLTAPVPGRGLSDDPDPVLRDGTTAFLRAAKTGDIGAMRLLLEHTADPNIPTAYGTTPLMVAAGLGWRYGQSVVPEDAAIESVKLCLELGADINALNERGQTALHGAAERGSDRLVHLLVERGARVDVSDKNGNTPLDVAAGKGGGHPPYPSTLALLRELNK